MPRKPTRRSHLLKPQPALSRFARLMALIKSARKAKQQNKSSTLHKKILPKSTGIIREDEHNSPKSKRKESHSSSEDEDFDGIVQADFAFFDPKPDDFHGIKVLLQTYLDNKEWDLSSFVDLVLQQTTVGTVIKIEDDEDNAVYGFISALNLHRYKPTEELRRSFRFKYYLSVSKVYKLKKGDHKKKVGSSNEEDVIYLKPEDEIFHNLSEWSFYFPLRSQQVTTSEISL